MPVWLAVPSCPLSSQSKKIISQGFGVWLLSGHWSLSLNRGTLYEMQARILRNNACFDIAALIGTLRNEINSPFHTAVKALPTPIRLTAHIADLQQRNRDDFTVTHANTIETPLHMELFSSARSSRWFALKLYLSAISSAVLWLTDTRRYRIGNLFVT